MFVKLTSTILGSSIYFNIDNIETIENAGNGKSFINTISGKCDGVNESSEQIVSMIAAMKGDNDGKV